MKTQMANQFPHFRNLIAKISLIAVFTLSVLTIKAQDTTRKPYADVKYLGLVNDKLIVQIEVLNDAFETFTIEIKDEKGNQFFHEKFKEKKFKRQFSIDKFDVQSAVNIEIKSRNIPDKQVFTLNSTSKIVDYVSIVRKD